jgi:tetratricopeptide (TPR) repeat protein
MNINWLHLTDLHRGMDAQHSIWPNIEEEFYEDLERLHDRCGPWDLILFTGDLVQRGAAKEFDVLTKTLKRIYKKLSKLGSKPLFLAVPGNHDLVRPRSNLAEVRLLREWATHPEVQDEFWRETKCSYRKVIGKSFENYVNWYQYLTLPKPKQITLGLLPGDFSATVKKEGVSLGIVGLNSTFLQLTEGDYKGRLALDPSQLVSVCGEHFPDWFNKHELCFLMTHQPPDWLSPKAREKLDGDIYPPGRFVAHLCGHMHEHSSYKVSVGGARSRRYWQGCSLFGLEFYGEKQEAERRHGYTAARIEVDGSIGRIRLWPRVAERHQAGHWHIIPDPRSTLERDGGTPAESIELKGRVTPPSKRPKPSPPGPTRSESATPLTLKPYPFSPLPVEYVPRSRKNKINEDLLGILTEKLAPSENEVNLVVLSGPAGTGKTATAQEAIKAVSGKYSNRVIWVDASNSANVGLSEVIDEIIRRFDPDGTPPSDPASRMRKARLLLESGPTLIAIDDFEIMAPDELSRCVDWIRSHTGRSALLIARDTFLAHRLHGIDRREDVDDMTPPEAGKFWTRLVHDVAQHKHAFSKFTPEEVVGKFGTNPFILYQGVFIHVATGGDWKTVESVGLVTEEVEKRYFRRSFELPQVGSKGRKVLLALSLFTPHASREALAKVAGLDSRSKGFTDSVAKLTSLWLISPALADEQRLTMDKLNRRYAREYLDHHRLARELQPRFVQHFAEYVVSHARSTAEDFNAIEMEKDNIFEAMNIARTVDRPNLTKIFDVLGRLHNGFFEHRGYWRVALTHGEHAIEAARALNDKKMVARFTCMVAGLHLKFSENESARQLLQPLLRNGGKPVSKQSYIDALHLMGMLEFNEHNYKDAEKRFSLELAASEKAKSSEINLRGVANATQELGRIARLRGRFNKARTFYKRSRDVREKLKDAYGNGDLGAPKSSLHDLGLLAQQQGEWEEQFRGNYAKVGKLYDEALDYYEQARAIKETLGNYSSLAHTLTEMAELKRLQAGLASSKREKALLYKEARALLEQSLEIKEEVEDKAHAAYTKYILGRLALDQGKWREAQKWCGESRKVRDDNNDRAGIAGCRYLKGLIAEYRGDKGEAARLFGLALDTWHDMGLVAADYARAALMRVSDGRSLSSAGRSR